ITVLILSCGNPQKRNEPVELAGEKAPAKFYEIDFNKRYDLITQGYRGERLTYTNCKILGSTRPAEPKQSSGLSSYSEYFEKWLVIELPDGRLAYLPADHIDMIEETSVGRNPQSQP